MSGNNDDGCGQCASWVWLIILIGAAIVGILALLAGDQETAGQALQLPLIYCGLPILIALLGVFWNKIKELFGRTSPSNHPSPNDVMSNFLLIYRAQGKQGLESYLQLTGLPHDQLLSTFRWQIYNLAKSFYIWRPL